MVESFAMRNESSRLKRKEKVYQKLTELTRSLSLQKSAEDFIFGFDTDLISRSLNIGRNNVSKELNQLLREGKVVKILGKPVLYLDRICLAREMNIRTDSPVITSYEEARRIFCFSAADNQSNGIKNDNQEKLAGTEPISQGRINQKIGNAEIHGNNDTVLDNIIGAKDSLKAQVEQAKAAILYPPNGLHTLIVGATGVGKSTFAEAMYRYAVQCKKLSDGAPFVVFNCADYAENPQLLLAQLFGHVKGAFTGADKEKKGLIDKANGGILFLDEVHRLPPEGQEMMFLLMDKGTYRRLGESENTRYARVLIIAATTEDPKIHILRTFLRRIPVVIKLPSIRELNLKERMSIIFNFFREESERVRVPIKVSKDVLQGFLFYECPGNIGQLKSDIQLVCARAFLDYMTDGGELMEVKLSHIPWAILENFLKVGENGESLARSTNLDDSQGIIFRGLLPNDSDRIMERLFEDEYRTGENFYDLIVSRWQEFSHEGLSDTAIRQKMTMQIESYFQSLFPKVRHRGYESNGEVSTNITSQWIFQAIKEALEEMDLGSIELSDPQVIYGLALHVGTLLERLRLGMKVYHPYKNKIEEQHPDEYREAARLKEMLEKKFSISIPDDEVGFLTMFLYAVKSGKNKRCIGVLVITHGQSAASTMVEVVNTLLGSSNASAIDMPLNEKLETVLEKAVEETKRLDNGRGVIILVDMGSLAHLSDVISKRTGIPTRTVEMVSTPMVIEAVRKSILPDMNLDTLVQHVKKTASYIKPKGYLPEIEGENGSSRIMESVLEQVLNNTLTFLDQQKACTVLGCVLRNIFQDLGLPVSREIAAKFIFHCSCMIERLIRKEPLPYEGLENIRRLHSRLYGITRKHFELAEDTFGILIPDSELAYIVEMINVNTHLNNI